MVSMGVYILRGTIEAYDTQKSLRLSSLRRYLVGLSHRCGYLLSHAGAAFNQVLAEDNSVNRLADSFKLWKMISGNKLLASVNFILFLNKMDILDAHLKSGIQFNRYVPNYKDKPNVTEHVAKCTFTVGVGCGC